MRRRTLLPLFALIAVFSAAPATARAPLPACEWCGAMDAPPDDQLSSTMTIAGTSEPGERIILRGRVLKPDGRTPAPDVLVYAYHTDTSGEYRREGNETGNAQRHGVLRGWLRTDAEGRYEIRTIKPAGYPGRPDPQHIHVTLEARGGSEHWIDDFWFEGDPRITKRHRAGVEPSSIVLLKPNAEGVLTAERDLKLRE